MKMRLKGLDVSQIQYPDDKATIDKLNKMPGFKVFLQKTVANVMEKYAAIQYSAEGINVTDKSCPDLNKQLMDSVQILDMQEMPSCSIDWSYTVSSFSVGESHKRIILQSGCVDLLNKEELYFVIGHELGHMKCGHKIYHMLTESLYLPFQNTPELVFWTSLIKMPLLNWYRISDFTADRLGLLCCQDINVALGTMIKMAGLPKKCYDQINISAFIQQADHFGKEHSGMIDNMVKYLSINAAAMPWLIMRASELLNWYNSREYSKIINQCRS